MSMNDWQRQTDGQRDVLEQQRQREEQLRQQDLQREREREEQLRQQEREREEQRRQREQEQLFVEERQRQWEQDRLGSSTGADRGFLSRWFGRKSTKPAATQPAPGRRSAARPRRR